MRHRVYVAGQGSSPLVGAEEWALGFLGSTILVFKEWGCEVATLHGP